MCPALIGSLKACLTDYTPAVGDAWKTLFNIIAELVEHCMRIAWVY
jgi:hypothetical protein